VEDGLDLELELASAEPGRFVITVRSPAGEGTGEFRLDALSVLGQRSQLQSTVLASAVTSRRALGEVEAPVREVGELLFRSLFNADVYGAYKASIALTQQRGLPLRIVLRTQVPELAALPWEMMYDKAAGAYLCQRDPLIRHVSVASPSRPLEVRPPLRVLGMVAAPRDKQRLDVEGEKHRLTTALGGLGARVQLNWVQGGSWADLQGELVSSTWHVVHFIGHGGFDVHRGEGVLALEGDGGASDLVGAERFSQLLTTQVPPPQLVVLNSCAGAQAAADDLFSSTAASLVRAGVSASVAMQFAVSDPAAKAFAAGFYQAIAHNHSVADAVRIGRIGIRGTSEDTLEWVTPALYLRGADAPLFTVLGSNQATGDITAPAPEQAARLAGAQALYQQGMSHFRAARYRDAVTIFDSLLSLEPGYRDAETRRNAAATLQQAKDAYDAAQLAEEAGRWDDAVRGYGETLRLQPDHAEARARQDHCRRQHLVANLLDELRQHVQAHDWAAAAAVADEVQTIDPDVHDPEGLISAAHEGAATEGRVPNRSDPGTVPIEPGRESRRLGRDTRAPAGPDKPEQDGASTPPPDVSNAQGSGLEPTPRLTLSRGWYVLIAAVVLALVAGGLLFLRTKPADSTGGGETVHRGSNVSVLKPFHSATLFEMARHLFDVANGACFIPGPKDAPLAYSLKTTELVKCYRAPYSGTFWCAADVNDFDTNRAKFLSYAVPGTMRTVEGPPAGSRVAADGIQRAFIHTDGYGARVYWDNKVKRCAGELQATTNNVKATIDHWRNGAS
jgi:tetratricopeptide (TPR) repeat protein